MLFSPAPALYGLDGISYTAGVQEAFCKPNRNDTKIMRLAVEVYVAFTRCTFHPVKHPINKQCAMLTPQAIQSRGAVKPFHNLINRGKKVCLQSF